MSNRTLLSRQGTVHQIVHHDNSDPDNLIIETVEDIEPILARAKLLSEQSPRRGETFTHVAVAPDYVCAQALREKWTSKDWDNWINDHSNRPFRTYPGIV